MPVMYPFTSNRTLVPRSIALGSLVFACAGCAKPSQIVHGQAAGRGVPVVNVQLYDDGIWLPEVSVARTVAVYVVPPASCAFGVNVATVPVPSSATVPLTDPLPEASVNVSPTLVTGSLNVALGVADSCTPVAPVAGEVVATAGGWVSGGFTVVKTTSTQ